MYEFSNNSSNPRNFPKNVGSATYRSERRISSATVVKNRPDKFEKKNYWCAPRKAGSKNLEKKVENVEPPVKPDIEKPKKKRRKKVCSRKLRRIDILAQPKSQNYPLTQKKHSPTVPQSTQKNRTVKVSTATEKKTRKPLKSGKGSLLQQFSKIMQSKKLQRRLFSLVTNKIKEMKNSGKI